MTTPIEKYKTVTNFRFPTMMVRIFVESSESLSDFKKQADMFMQLQGIMANFQGMNIDQIPDLLDALRAVENIKTVEIINPANNNGFIFEL